MPFDCKKEYKELYLSSKTLGIITVSAMEQYATASGHAADFGENRFLREIYLSDVRRCKPEQMKTVIRQPIRRIT